MAGYAKYAPGKTDQYDTQLAQMHVANVEQLQCPIEGERHLSMKCTAESEFQEGKHILLLFRILLFAIIFVSGSCYILFFYSAAGRRVHYISVNTGQSSYYLIPHHSIDINTSTRMTRMYLCKK